MLVLKEIKIGDRVRVVVSDNPYKRDTRHVGIGIVIEATDRYIIVKLDDPLKRDDMTMMVTDEAVKNGNVTIRIINNESNLKNSIFDIIRDGVQNNLTPKFVQFNGDYTTVVWKDGTHTVVKKAEGEEYDEEKAILFAIVKHLCNDNGCEMNRYLYKFCMERRKEK